MIWLRAGLQLLLTGLACGSGLADTAAGKDDGEVPIRTIIDVLSSSPQFSTLVQLLQKRRLVPVVNTSFNSTYLAPVNSAFAGVDLDAVTDSQLLYHFIRAPVVHADFQGDEDGLILPTYYTLGSPPDDDDDDGEGHYAPVRIRLGEVNNGEADILEYDLMASPQRGVVHAISDLLDIPRPMCEELLVLDPELRIFGNLVNSANSICRSFSEGVTLFAPVDEAMEEHFAEIELRYLQSQFGTDDRQRLVRSHVVSQILRPQDLPAKVHVLDGSVLEVERNMSIDGIDAVAGGAWKVASDGIFAAVDGYIGAEIKFTPEKYIDALGGSKFAHLVSVYGHDDFIDGRYNGSQTIIVPVAANEDSQFAKRDQQLLNDELLNDELLNDEYRIARPDDVTLYQFIDEQLSVNATGDSNHSNRTLLNSRMLLRSGKFPQKVHYERRKTGSVTLNWQNVLSPEYQLGNTSIYTMDGLLSVPPRLSMALGPLFMSSHSLTFLDQLDRLTLPTKESWTLFLPTREAWEAKTLIRQYLATHVDALSRVFDNFIVSTPLYTCDSHEIHTRQFMGYNTSVVINEPAKDRFVFEVNGTSHLEAEITDVLFDNGVAHIVSNFDLPNDLEIGCADLVSAGGRSEFLDIVKAAGMEGVIDDAANLTLIVPNPTSLESHNYTVDSPLADLQKLVGLHVIEGNPFAGSWKDGLVATTVGDEDIVLGEVAPGVYSLSLTSGSGQRALVTSWSHTNGEVSGGSTIIFVDRFINPHWIQSPLIPPPFRLHTHTVLLLGIVLGLMSAVIFGLVVIYLWFTDAKAEIDAPQSSRGSIDSAEDRPVEPYRDEPEGPTQPMRTPAVNEDRAYGRHLDLP